MKLKDLTFAADDCCGTHKTATVTLPDGRLLGITQGLGTYGVSVLSASGMLLQRLSNQTEAQVNALME